MASYSNCIPHPYPLTKEVKMARLLTEISMAVFPNSNREKEVLHQLTLPVFIPSQPLQTAKDTNPAPADSLEQRFSPTAVFPYELRCWRKAGCRSTKLILPLHCWVRVKKTLLENR